MKTIGILGGKGMLGSDLTRFLSDTYSVVPIDKDDYENNRGRSFDVFINANGNSRRFWANQHPQEDFEASTVSVYNSFLDFKADKYIYISSSDVYNHHEGPETAQENTPIDAGRLEPYGLHKFISEYIVRQKASDYLILRASMMLGSNLKKGPFYDIFSDRPLFITHDTRLQFITTQAVAQVVQVLLEKDVAQETFNVGGVGAFSFTKLGEYIEKSVTVSSEAKKQEYEMNVEKLSKLYPLQTSEEYLKSFLGSYANQQL